MSSVTLLLFLQLLSLAHAGNVLFSLMCQGRSHARSALQLAKSLTKRGHNVTFYFEIQDEEIPLSAGIVEHFVKLDSGAAMKDDFRAFQTVIWNQPFDGSFVGGWFSLGAKAFTDTLVQKPADFWRIANASWDVIIVDSFFAVSGYAIALYNPAPVIIFHPTDMFEVYNYHSASSRMIGLRSPMILDESLKFDVSQFWDRVKSVWQSMKIFYVAQYFGEKTIKEALDVVEIHGFSWQRLLRAASLIITDYPYNLNIIQPVGNDFVQSGAYCSSVQTVMDDKMEQFVSDPASMGTIFFSLGTIVQWGMAPEHIKQIFVQAFNNLSDYRIVWSYNGDNRPEVKSHIMITDWANQLALLNHPKTKLFISHAGLKSFKEAICSKTPTLFIPMFAEQTLNTMLGTNIGFANQISKLELSSERVEAIIRAMLADEKYRLVAARTKRIFTDTLIGSDELGAFWVERVMHRKGAPVMFQRYGAFMSVMQFFCFDFALLGLSVLVAVVLLIAFQ